MERSLHLNLSTDARAFADVQPSHQSVCSCSVSHCVDGLLCQPDAGTLAGADSVAQSSGAPLV
jgi:hypothetical protein